MNRTLLAGLVGGLVGGLLSAVLAVHIRETGFVVNTAAAAPAHAEQALVASRIELRDASGKLRAELAMSADGGPGLFFFDSAGRNRLVMGLYSQAENEAPSLVLNDPQQHAAGIFRLFGSRDTPVLVLKSQGRDRSVYGLNAGSTDPFLANYAADGTKSDVFGHD
ncbi:MAG TPA: hypothetical protein VGH75_08790 [Steroidobacteraceae bacterium]